MAISTMTDLNKYCLVKSRTHEILLCTLNKISRCHWDEAIYTYKAVPLMVS